MVNEGGCGAYSHPLWTNHGLTQPDGSAGEAAKWPLSREEPPHPSALEGERLALPAGARAPLLVPWPASALARSQWDDPAARQCSGRRWCPARNP